jgi:prepilin-type N-terminal cleavage/methylation domain-containing protein
MKRRTAFTLIELLVVIAIIALLMAILMPALRRVKKQAETVGCIANLKEWGLVSAMYAEANDGIFWSGIGNTGYWWPWQLTRELQDWKMNKTWLCPTAQKPIYDENGVMLDSFNIFNAWGIFKGTQGGISSNPNGVAGSYSINGYVLSIPMTATFEGGVSAKDGWRSANSGGVSNVPLFLDALRFDLWPLDTQGPADYEFAAWTANNMGRCCINRHDGYVGCVFLDYSARKIGLKELWTLKWHKKFNIAGPWTKAGNVQSSNWPEWVRNFKDY